MHDHAASTPPKEPRRPPPARLLLFPSVIFVGPWRGPYEDPGAARTERSWCGQRQALLLRCPHQLDRGLLLRRQFLGLLLRHAIQCRRRKTPTLLAELPLDVSGREHRFLRTIPNGWSKTERGLSRCRERIRVVAAEILSGGLGRSRACCGSCPTERCGSLGPGQVDEGAGVVRTPVNAFRTRARTKWASSGWRPVMSRYMQLPHS